MKTIVKIFVGVVSMCLWSTSSLMAKTTGLKTTMSQLIEVEEELEAPVEDVIFTTEETVRYTRLKVIPSTTQGNQTPEQLVDDVHFTDEEINRYRHTGLQLTVTNLWPVGEEVEEALPVAFATPGAE